MVFFSSCNSVKYHYELLNYIDLPVAHIHVSIFEILAFLPYSVSLGYRQYQL